MESAWSAHVIVLAFPVAKLHRQTAASGDRKKKRGREEVQGILDDDVDVHLLFWTKI